MDLARALAVEPSVLMLDEPFDALDAKVPLELRRSLRQLHDEIHITGVFVTHETPFVYRFLGHVNLFHGRINEGQTYLHDHATQTQGAHGADDTVVYVRPHFLEINREPNGAATFRATIRDINAAGPLSSGGVYRMGRTRPSRDVAGSVP